MASFAKLDFTNTVTQIIKIGEDVVTSNGPLGENNMHPDGEKYCNELLGGNWKQTSQSNSFRNEYAKIGGTYDPVNDVFISPQPYVSWTLNENFKWVPPVPMYTKEPFVQFSEGLDNSFIDINFRGEWNEENQRWEAKNKDNVLYVWNAETSLWVTA
jgi:hypothetical protein